MKREGRSMKLQSSRAHYDDTTLDETVLDANPLVQLRRWLDVAYATPAIVEPNAMCLASVDLAGQPSARMVLLRGLDERGLVFYTSYDSRKGRELAANTRVAATFYWGALQRQVRIEGSVTELSADESDTYFASRPRGHRLSAWASEQSEPVDSRATLDARVAHFDERFDEEVPRPHSWGGYLIAPSKIEFWQGRPNRMHDRLEYTRSECAWFIRRLQP